MVGTDQSDLSPLLAVNGRLCDEPPYLALSESYAEHVRSGFITVSRGRLASLVGNRAVLTPPGGGDIADVAAVVLATGFDAAPSVSFLPDAVLSTLGLAAANLDNTVALAFHGTHHPAIPTLGFVGFYRSPYWGVMEMQARLVTALWSPGARPAALQRALDSDRSIERTLALRADPRTSQFPMGDYAYLMGEFAAALELPMAPPLAAPEQTPPPLLLLPHNGKAMDVLTPARYPPRRMTDAQRAENAAALAQTRDTVLAALTAGRFVARAVFRSLLGVWDLRRTVTSALPSHPSGTFAGTARFLPRDSTSTPRADGAPRVSLHRGRHLLRRRRLLPRNPPLCLALRRGLATCSASGSCVPTTLGLSTTSSTTSSFCPLRPPSPPLDPPLSRGWEAKAGHLCEQDFYDVRYEFCFRAVNLQRWNISYSVKGPKKDYTIDGLYTRPAPVLTRPPL